MNSDRTGSVRAGDRPAGAPTDARTENLDREHTVRDSNGRQEHPRDRSIEQSVDRQHERYGGLSRGRRSSAGSSLSVSVRC